MLARISKALAGALASGVSALVGVWPDGVTPEEWGKVAAAAVVGGFTVYWAPRNAPPKGEVVPLRTEKQFGPGRG